MLGCRDTALHVAAASKGARTRAAMVLFLIAERADVNKANKKGCATRQRARRPRRRACCAVSGVSGSPGCRYTALHYAAMSGHTDAAVPLLVGGADQTIKTKDGLVLSGYVTSSRIG